MKFNFASHALSGCLGLALVVPAASGLSTAARAEDQLKVAIGQINNWENQAPTLGQDAGGSEQDVGCPFGFIGRPIALERGSSKAQRRQDRTRPMQQIVENPRPIRPRLCIQQLLGG